MMTECLNTLLQPARLPFSMPKFGPFATLLWRQLHTRSAVAGIFGVAVASVGVVHVVLELIERAIKMLWLIDSIWKSPKNLELFVAEAESFESLSLAAEAQLIPDHQPI